MTYVHAWQGHYVVICDMYKRVVARIKENTNTCQYYLSTNCIEEVVSKASSTGFLTVGFFMVLKK